jgi:hypothetical protein
MTETYRTQPPEPQWADSHSQSDSHRHGEPAGDGASNEAGKALLVGVLGGLAAAAGYLVFQRLPEDQKSRLQSQAKQLLQERITEIRRNFNV